MKMKCKIILHVFIIILLNLFCFHTAFGIEYDTYSVRSKYLSFLGNSIPSNYVSALAVDLSDNSLFIGTDNGLCKYNGKYFRIYGKDPGHFKHEPIGKFINYILPTTSEIWIATDSGLSRYNKILSLWTHFEKGDNETTIPTNYIQCLYFIDPILYVGTWGSGFSAYNVKINKWKHYGQASISSKYITSIDYDPIKEQIWIGTYDYGLFVFHAGRFINFNAKNSDLISNKINCLKVYENKVYIGTPKGLSVYNGIKFKNYDKSTLGTNCILSILAYKFDIFLGTDNGLVKISNDIVTQYPIKNFLSNGKPVRILSMAVFNNKLFLGTQHHGLIEVVIQ